MHSVLPAKEHGRHIICLPARIKVAECRRERTKHMTRGMVRLIWAIAAPAIMATSPAAAIVCDGPYQVINGSPHATPYCQDNYLAQVARSYGMRTSESAVRNNPGIKDDLCRVIGYDNRVSDICGYYQGDHNRRRRMH
jgi:hypothetical protein